MSLSVVWLLSVVVELLSLGFVGVLLELLLSLVSVFWLLSFDVDELLLDELLFTLFVVELVTTNSIILDESSLTLTSR